MATTRRKPLSRERILAAALELADEQGIEALSMRKLGQAVGYEAMSLYNHVANKGDLVDAIVDRVVGEIELPEGADDEWEAAIRTCAVSAHEAFVRHPWACSPAMSPARSVTPPPHGLSRGNVARSTSSTLAPAEARRCAAVEPAGPAPTTATSNALTGQSYNAAFSRGCARAAKGNGL